MKDSNRKDVASLTLGIVSLIMLFTVIGSVVGIILAIIGVVLGNQVKKVDPSNSLAKAGRVLCWICLIVCIAVVILASFVFGRFV